MHVPKDKGGKGPPTEAAACHIARRWLRQRLVASSGGMAAASALVTAALAADASAHVAPLGATMSLLVPQTFIKLLKDQRTDGGPCCYDLANEVTLERSMLPCDAGQAHLHCTCVASML